LQNASQFPDLTTHNGNGAIPVTIAAMDFFDVLRKGAMHWGDEQTVFT
jgi:hypothetical protein